jgi:hypothetical protein
MMKNSIYIKFLILIFQKEVACSLKIRENQKL